jgi:ubiquinone/menaquinone biosynthesis C-methylase UbiE
MLVSAEVGLRERAETERSLSEARHTENLRIAEAQLRRYIAPPADTPYPLEYSFHLLANPRGQRVVDFGCGSGANSVLLARRGANIVGIDISEALLTLAKRRVEEHGYPNSALFCAASAHQLPLADASVDVVFGIAILHHLDIDVVRQEVLRILKTGGRAIFQEPVRESPMLRYVRRFLPWQDADVSPYEQPLTAAAVKVLSRGFAARRIRAFVLPHVTLSQRLGAPDKFVHWCYRLDGRILKWMPRLGRYASIRVIELTK